MGRNLTLIMINGSKSLKGSGAVTDFGDLDFVNDNEILRQIKDLGNPRTRNKTNSAVEVFPLPPQIQLVLPSYESEGGNYVRHDGRRRELTFTYAKQLKKIKPPKRIHFKNKAILAFIHALPDDIPFILWWC